MFLISFLSIFILAENAFSDVVPSQHVITIKSVELEKDSGGWVTIIEPDHQVDLANQEAVISFFNNGRRVPPGSYRNFKIIFDNEETGEKIRLYGVGNFSEPLKVAPRSFISVSFELNLARTLRDSRVKQVAVVVDEQALTIPGELIQMVF